MLQYLLTGIAGIALGIVAMRVWQAREAAPTPTGEAAPEAPASSLGATLQGLGTGRMLLLGAGGLVLVAIAILAFRGGSTAPAGPATGGPAVAGSELGDVDSMIARLAARLEKEPNDGEGFRMLGWSYVMTGHPDKAIEPYKRALKLLPDQAPVHAGYAEALVGLAGGKVTSEAKAEFDRAIKLDPTEPRARYFQALWLDQNGQSKQALEQLIALANSGTAEAPWQGDVQGKIKDIAAKLGVDVSGRVKPAAQIAAGTVPPPNAAQAAAVNALPPAQKQATIDSMVEGLASKLKANPRDAKGWAMLLRSRMVMKQDKQAADDLGTARKALASDPDGLAQVNAAARDAGVPGA
jgi:cytochrome c-type biogenesis protein CcmH